MDRAPAPQARSRADPKARNHRRRQARRASTCKTRVAGTSTGARHKTRARRLEGQRAKSTVAMGLVFAAGAHLLELAACHDAGVGPRLCDDSRADALTPHGSLQEVLETRRRAVTRLSGRATMAARNR